MKKIFAVILSVMMIASLSVTSFAASFVSSPSGNPAPTLDSFEFESKDCTAGIQITPYSKRDTLTDQGEKDIEAAYANIKSTDDVSSLNADLAALAKSKEINGKNLAVSDLFDVSYTGCDDHGEHGKVTVKLNAETLKDFVGLLHYKNGKWELVANAKAEGDTLTFSVDSLSPFAIVVDATRGSSDTGDNGGVYILVAVAALSLAAAVVFFLRSRKEIED